MIRKNWIKMRFCCKNKDYFCDIFLILNCQILSILDCEIRAEILHNLYVKMTVFSEFFDVFNEYFFLDLSQSFLSLLTFRTAVCDFECWACNAVTVFFLSASSLWRYLIHLRLKFWQILYSSMNFTVLSSRFSSYHLLNSDSYSVHLIKYLIIFLLCL